MATERPRLTRRWVLGGSLAAAGAGGALLSACSLPGRPTGATEPGRLKSGITLLMMQQGTAPEGESKLEVLRLFEQKHPGIKTELDNTGNAEKIQALTAAGTPPDVFWFNPALFLQYTRRGFFLELTPRLRRDRYDLSDFAEKSLEQYHWEGKQWAMPKDFPTRGMFYNVDLFEQAGLPHPPGNYSDQSWTWDRFMEAAQRLTRDRGGAMTYGFGSGTGFRAWAVWVYCNGGEFVSRDAGECVLHEARAVEALQFLQDLRLKHRFWALPPETNQGATFTLGRIAMTEAAPPGVGTNRRQIREFVWDATHIPRSRNGRYAATGGGLGQGIASATKHPDEAWELLKHLLSPEAIFIELVREGLNMPARKSLANSKEYLQTGQPPKNLKVFVEGLPYLRLDPQATNWGEIEAATNREMAPLWSGEKPAREVAQAVKRAVDPLLKEAEARRRL